MICPKCGKEATGWMSPPLAKMDCCGHLRDTECISPAEFRREKDVHAQIQECARFSKQLKDAECILQYMREGVAHGFWLEDVNTEYNECGHFPEYAIRVACSADAAEHVTYDEARKVATEKNNAVAYRWKTYLNG